MPRNLSSKILYGLLAAVLIWLLVRFLLPITLPFLLGLWLAVAAEPGVRLMNGRLRLPRWAASALSVTVVFLLTVTLLVLLAGMLMRQLGRLQDVLPQLAEAASQGLQAIEQWLMKLAARLPNGLGAALENLLIQSPSQNGGLLQQAVEKLPQMATRILGRLSSGLFGLLTGIISGYMISGRLPKLRQKLSASLPESWKNRYLPALKGMRKALFGWLLAELKLAGVAFVLLTVGFWILRVDNSLLLAALITIVDAFPVLGVGTVLIPWSLVCLLQGDLILGLGILGLYIAIWLIRSVLEPRLVGKGLGLDPLLTLITIYAGWRLLGITGMLLAPILTMAALQMTHALRQ